MKIITCLKELNEVKVHPSDNLELNFNPTTMNDDDLDLVLEFLKINSTRCLTLNLQGCLNRPDSIPKIAAVLSEKKFRLLEINLSDCKIDDAGAKVIADFLNRLKCTRLELKLVENRIRDQGAKDLALAISHYRAHLIIDLTDNFIDQEGAQDFISLLENKVSHAKRPLPLLQIQLADNMFKGDILNKITAAVKTFNQAREMDKELQVTLASIPKKATLLNTLNLTGLSCLNDDNMDMLTHCFSKINHPGNLFLSFNEARLNRVESIQKLTGIFTGRHYNKLSLDLRFIPIGIEGAKILADCMVKLDCTHLHLNLASTHINDESAMLLANAIKKCQFALDIKLNDNDMGKESELFIFLALQRKNSPQRQSSRQGFWTLQFNHSITRQEDECEPFCLVM